MSTRTNVLLAAMVAAAISVTAQSSSSGAANLTAGMQKGTPQLKSAGPATFAPQGILLVGDTQGAAIYAIATGDKSSGSPSQPFSVDNIDQKIAAMLGTTPADILINDMAVNPETGSVFLTVSRGRGPDAKPVIFRVDSAGSLEEFGSTMCCTRRRPFPTRPRTSSART